MITSSPRFQLTSVKSFGWVNGIAHPSPDQSRNVIDPCVVSVEKFGASASILGAMLSSRD
jgi:hypothetical protein|tara:strand:- start:320 stop:499 length:180 start_codon:yes stop_codon:yes gene_type:complete